MKRLAVLIACGCIMHASSARAVTPDDPDTAHGRIDGDLAAVLGAGATFGPRSPRATIDARLRYIWTAGAFVTYEDGPLLSGNGAEPRRALATGLEIRPLFLARWLNGLETGSPYADLTIDSFGLELGAVFQQPEGSHFSGKPGLQAGIGMEVPILPRASGPLLGLHAGARWSDAALGGRSGLGPADRALYLSVTLAWQQVFGGHIVDLGDRRPR